MSRIETGNLHIAVAIVVSSISACGNFFRLMWVRRLGFEFRWSLVWWRWRWSYILFQHSSLGIRAGDIIRIAILRFLSLHWISIIMFFFVWRTLWRIHYHVSCPISLKVHSVMTLYSEILNSAQSVFVAFLINSIDAIALLFTKQDCMHKGWIWGDHIGIANRRGARDHGWSILSGMASLNSPFSNPNG